MKPRHHDNRRKDHPKIKNKIKENINNISNKFECDVFHLILFWLSKIKMKIIQQSKPKSKYSLFFL